jgi:RNA polymerase sigma-70 factor, ECF subfamily
MPLDDQCDRDLMTRLARGDVSALETLIDRWQRPLHSFVFRYLQDGEAARELVQETFLRVYHARERYDRSQRFAGWLFRIAANLARNRLRWRRRHPEVSLDDEGPPAEASGTFASPLTERQHPGDVLAGAEAVAALREAIAQMPHALKTTLLLHYYEELSYREIAGALGCSERGVESRLYRARRWLARRLAPEAEEASAGVVARLSRPASGLIG